MLRHAGMFTSSSCCFGSEKMVACGASERVISVIFSSAIEGIWLVLRAAESSDRRSGFMTVHDFQRSEPQGAFASRGWATWRTSMNSAGTT